MSSEQHRPGTPAWKKDAGGRSRKQAAGPAWKRDTAPAAAPGGLTRGSKLGLAGGALLTLCGILVWVAYLLRPPAPACLVLLGAGYEDNLAVPHNVYGWNGLNGLGQMARGSTVSWFWWKSGLLRLQHEDPLEVRTEVEWDRGLDQTPEKTVLLFLALHGGTDSQGAYLLPQNADLRKEGRLRLEKVIARAEQLAANRNVVLMLDATQVAANWPQGMIHNDFARRLRDFDERITKCPNLVVLSASEPDQRSWNSPEWRMTIFAHFVIEGLRGAAARDGNKRISAWDLHEYVSRNVERWVRANQGGEARQTPVLIGGDDKARRIELTLAQTYAAAGPEETPGLKEKPDFTSVRDAWRTHGELRDQVPAPAAYSPQVWRRYEETLLRYEQLVHASDKRKAPELKRELDQLARKIQEERRLDLAQSAFNSLAMPNALGMTVPGADRELVSRFEELWRAPEAQVDQKWEQLQKSWDKAPAEGGETNKQLPRLKLAALLLNRAAADPRGELQKASRLLTLIGAGGNQRPAELHFLAMLPRHLDEKNPPPEELLIRALNLRRRAEEVALALPAARDATRSRGYIHPYSEYVFPWTHERVHLADERRRQGEDLLFASTPEHWANAAKHLAAAEEGYGAVQEDADTVRTAVHTTHEVLAALPHYSRWLAAQRAADATAVASVEHLWKQTHDLLRLLETPQPGAVNKPVGVDTLDLSPRTLKARSQEINDEFRKLEDQFTDYCSRLANVDLASVPRDIHDALIVPRLETELRLALLNNAVRVSQRLHQESADETKASGAKGPSEEQVREQVRSGAQRQGLLCLAALGQRWFDDGMFQSADQPAGADFLKTQGRLRGLAGTERWPEAAGAVGEDAGRRWARLAKEITDRTTRARAAGLDQAAGELLVAERLARQADGATAQALAVNPVQESRRLRMYHLLRGQARRTRFDHWFAEDQTAPQYYQAAGNRYLRDARALMEGNRDELSESIRRDRLALLTRDEDELGKAGELAPVLVEPLNLEITSERRLATTFRVDEAGWLPHGFPALWLETDKVLRLREAGTRRVLETGTKQPLDFALDLEPEASPGGRLQVDQSTVLLRGVYRGQDIKKTVPAHIHRVPNTTVSQPLVPKAAAVAVRATADLHDQFGPQNGAIAIVLDCSGSMGPQQNIKYTPQVDCPYKRAREALGEVLRSLPPGVGLSLWIYGQKTPGANDARDTIRQLRASAPWNPKDLGELMTTLGNMEPWDYTPLVRAIWRAKREGFTRNVRGFKTLLVLTDGADEGPDKRPLFEADKELHGLHNTKEIGKFLVEEFKDSGVRLSLIGFLQSAESDEDRKKLTSQFQEAIAKLSPQGRFYTVDKKDALIKRLREDLKQQLRFTIENERGGVAKGLPEEGEEVSRDLDQDRWVRLEPGSYILRVETTESLRQRIYVGDGDYLLVTLSRDGDRLRFGRVLYGEDPRWKARQNSSDWLLALLQNQYRQGSLDALVTLEAAKERSPEKGTLQQLRPRPQATWLEIKPQGIEDAPRVVRWSESPGYPAPAWRLHVADWPSQPGKPEPARPSIQAFWNWDEEVPGVTLTRGGDANFRTAFRSPEGVRVGRDVSSKAVVESVEIEDWDVETRPGEKPERVSCLVVRASYPKGNPVWVQLVGLDPQGQEHRFYDQANKYTGIFWTLREDVVRNSLKGLHLIALEQFRNSPRTLRVRLDAPPPDAEERPKAIPELYPHLR